MRKSVCVCVRNLIGSNALIIEIFLLAGAQQVAPNCACLKAGQDDPKQKLLAKQSLLQDQALALVASGFICIYIYIYLNYVYYIFYIEQYLLHILYPIVNIMYCISNLISYVPCHKSNTICFKIHVLCIIIGTLYTI